jgi:tetratricopeptide (TPR) repeat protein
MKGNYSLAESLAHSFLKTGQRAKDSNAFQSFGTHLAIIRWEQDRSEEILPAVDDFIERYPTVDAWKCVKLFLHCDLSRSDEIAHEFNHLARADFSSIQSNSTLTVSLCLLAEICSCLNDKKRARTLYEMLYPQRRQFAIIGFSTAFFGSVEHRLGMLSATLNRHEEAAGHFQRALAGHEKIGAQPWMARTQYQYAMMLLTGRTPADTRTVSSLIRQSGSISARLGMNNLGKKLDQLQAKVTSLA